MDNKFIILIGSRNNAQWVESNLQSILTQDYNNFKAVYFDDASEDGTGQLAEIIVRHDSRFSVYSSMSRQYKTWFFAGIETNKGIDLNDNDILVFLDGDDMFASENVLSYLNAVYNQTNCWMTYGGMRVWDGGETIVEPYPQNSEIPEAVKAAKAYRRDTWRTSHLKTMRGFLWKKMNKADLMHDGKYIVGPDDLAIMFAMLELCPPEKVYRVTDPLYIYNHTKENQKSRAFTDHKATNIDYEQIVRNRTPYDTISFVTPTLAGGLGNQMFEIAAAASLAKDNGATLIINNQEHILPNQGRNVNNYLTNFFRRIVVDPTIKPEHIYKRDLCTFEPIPYQRNLKIAGHFQSYKYFDHNREYIQKLFAPSDFIKEKIKYEYNPNPNNITAIQVRRGDYYKFPDHHPQLTPEYYAKAVKIVNPKIVWVFSDDIPWCQETLRFDCPVKYIKEEDYIEMCLISLCKNIIISNSSFGWWSSYLSNESNIYVPPIWFGKVLINDGFIYEDLILPEWNIVE